MDALRNKSHGVAHLDTGTRMPWRGAMVAVAACGVSVERYETVPWEQTAPEDRCKRCVKRAAAWQRETSWPSRSPRGDAAHEEV